MGANKKASMVNDWACSKVVTRFKYRYLVPLNEKVEEASRILLDMKRKWEPGQREKAETKYNLMQVKNRDFYFLHIETSVLVDQHEKLVNMIAQIYSAWYSKVSSKGKQPTEMMGMQAKELEDIFKKIFEAIEPLNLELKPPDGYKTK